MFLLFTIARVQLLHIERRKNGERREQINVCCANKSFLNFSTRNFHYIDCFPHSFFVPSVLFDFFFSSMLSSLNAPASLFKSGS